MKVKAICFSISRILLDLFPFLFFNIVIWNPKVSSNLIYNFEALFNFEISKNKLWKWKQSVFRSLEFSWIFFFLFFFFNILVIWKMSSNLIYAMIILKHCSILEFREESFESESNLFFDFSNFVGSSFFFSFFFFFSISR